MVDACFKLANVITSLTTVPLTICSHFDPPPRAIHSLRSPINLGSRGQSCLRVAMRICVCASWGRIITPGGGQSTQVSLHITRREFGCSVLVKKYKLAMTGLI